MNLERVLQVLGVGEGREGADSPPASPPPRAARVVRVEQAPEGHRGYVKGEYAPPENSPQGAQHPGAEVGVDADAIAARTTVRPGLMFSQCRPPSGGYKPAPGDRERKTPKAGS